MTGQVSGQVDPAFQNVREIFEASFADGQNLGAGVAVYVDGRLVVDLWGGVADKRTGRPWERDTPVVGFSCTKAITATAALRVLADTGLSADDPVARWWPEYACAGKESTITSDFFTHRAGLPVIDRPVTTTEAADPELMAKYLAAQAPLWEPGTRHGYHALTYGWLTGEIVRRHTGLSVGGYTRRHLSPDLHVGAPAAIVEHIAHLSFPPIEEQKWSGDPAPLDAAAVGRMVAAFRDPESLIRRSVANPQTAFGKPEVVTGGWPAVGLVATPRALATFYRDLIAGELLPEEILRDAIRERVRGVDEVLGLESAYGLGYTRSSHNMVVPDAARPNAFGHPGAGGSIGLGDIENRLAFAFIPNLRRDWLAGDRRAYRLLEAVYAAL